MLTIDPPVVDTVAGEVNTETVTVTVTLSLTNMTALIVMACL